MLVFNGFSSSNDTSIKFNTNIPKRGVKPLYWLIYHYGNIIYKMGNKLKKEMFKYLFMYLGTILIVTLTIKNYFKL